MAALTLLVGCANPDIDNEEDIGTAIAASTSTNGSFTNGSFTNGSFTNGSFTNGSFTNGSFTNGSTVVGWSINLPTATGTTANGVTIASLKVGEGTLYGLDTNGNEIDADDMLGATINATLREDGTPVEMSIDKVEHFTARSGDDLVRYAISFTLPGSGVTAGVCGRRANGDLIDTIPVNARWNYNEGISGGGARIDDASALTFTCAGYTLYKCLDAGYHVWDSALDDHHQTCTRLIRADYCGNGKPWTVDGTLINLYDHIGLEADTESWPLEAEWGPNGARCLSHQRIQDLPSVPTCAFEIKAKTCGKNVNWKKTLIVSEAL